MTSLKEITVPPLWVKYVKYGQYLESVDAFCAITIFNIHFLNINSIVTTFII